MKYIHTNLHCLTEISTTQGLSDSSKSLLKHNTVFDNHYYLDFSARTGDLSLPWESVISDEFKLLKPMELVYLTKSVPVTLTNML